LAVATDDDNDSDQADDSQPAEAAPAPAPVVRRPSVMLSGGSQRLSKVIRGDVSNPDNPLNDKPVLRPPPRGVVSAEEYEAGTAGKQIIDKARADAAEIKATAMKEREQVFEEARKEARAQVVATQAEEIARAKMQAAQILSNANADIIDLACKVASKIIGRDLERDPETLLEICATATEHTRAAKAMIMRVNPKDAAILREKKPRLMEKIGRTVEIAIREDADVEKGGCIIQTEFGSIDAQIGTQVGMLEALLKGDPGKKEVK
jgi:type III secretion protein L